MSETTVELFSETCEFEAMPQPERMYPVVITVTEKYLVWAWADDAAEALRNVNDCDTDYLDGERPFTAEVTDVEEADDSDVECARVEKGGDRFFGPWRPGEPPWLRPRTESDRAYVERCIAAEMAEGLPQRCATCKGHGWYECGTVTGAAPCADPDCRLTCPNCLDEPGVAAPSPLHWSEVAR